MIFIEVLQNFSEMVGRSTRPQHHLRFNQLTALCTKDMAVTPQSSSSELCLFFMTVVTSPNRGPLTLYEDAVADGKFHWFPIPSHCPVPELNALSLRYNVAMTMFLKMNPLLLFFLVRAYIP